MDRKLFTALKPGGYLLIADHSAKAGDGTSVGKTFHRIEEGVLRKEVEAAGFKLVAEGNFLRHREDTPRATGTVGHILCRPVLGGLHHQYIRI